MDNHLSIALIVFAIAWFVILFVTIRTRRISIRYSMIWFFAALMLLIVGIFPDIFSLINRLFKFAVVSNLIVGALITLLMVITFVLTLFVTKQKKQIDNLIQEISILKSERKKDVKPKN